MRVPLLVRFLGRIPARARSPRFRIWFQNLVDLAPTFLDYAASVFAEMEGMSQRAAWEDPGRRA
jgi:hypothetical protein